MKKTFNEALLEELRKGNELFKSLQELEDSGKFTEEEIQDWFEKYNK